MRSVLLLVLASLAASCGSGREETSAQRIERYKTEQKERQNAAALNREDELKFCDRVLRLQTTRELCEEEPTKWVKACENAHRLAAEGVTAQPTVIAECRKMWHKE